MTDLHAVLPAFPLETYGGLLPSLERSRITTTDLITLDANEIAKRAQLPLPRVKGLCTAVLSALQDNLGVGPSQHENSTEAGKKSLQQTGRSLVEKWQSISTLDETLDVALAGGIPTGYITEITGESGVGKTQMLLTLLLSAQLPAPHGLSRATLYISTESALPTSRLAQLLRSHPKLQNLDSKPSLDRVISVVTPDLESQDHILRYQVPVAVRRHNVGLIVLDSVAANYRAEFERSGTSWNGSNMAKRSSELVKLGQFLRELARTEDLAIVVANQVADRFVSPERSHRIGPKRTVYQSSPLAHKSNIVLPSSSAEPSSSLPFVQSEVLYTPSAPVMSDIMTLDHQQRWFTGWGNDRSVGSHKTPSLGMIWTNQIACRIALIKSSVRTHTMDTANAEGLGGPSVPKTWRRWINVVFAPWAPPSLGDYVGPEEKDESPFPRGMLEFEITPAGLRVIGTQGEGKFKRVKHNAETIPEKLSKDGS